MRCRNLLVIAMLAVMSPGPFLAAEEAPGEPSHRKQDEQAIRATAKQYLDALARRDAKTLASLWMPDGELMDASGRSYPAREVIEQEAGQGPHPAMKLTATSIRFLTGDVALEDGMAEVAGPTAQAPPLKGRFTVLWVKHDGKWRLASLRESRVEPPSAVTELADLDWMTGEWSGQDHDTTVEISAQWDLNRTFLVREIRLLSAGQVAFSASQRIGWDPLTQKIKSWIFDSHGGHGEGFWMKDGETWSVQASGVLPDGKRTSSINAYTPEGKDRFTWKSIHARTDGESVPDLEIKLVRKPTEP